MSPWFLILTIVFIIVSAVMILIILVQRPSGGGLAGAFGGAGASGTETVFGGRVGDALTIMTIVAFVAYMALAIGLNVLDPKAPTTVVTTQPAATTLPEGGTESAQTQPEDGSAERPFTITPDQLGKIISESATDEADENALPDVTDSNGGQSEEGLDGTEDSTPKTPQ